MKIITNQTPVLRTTVIAVALSAMLTACGGSSSGRNQGPAELLLDDSTRALAVRSVTYDLWQTLDQQYWAAKSAFSWLAHTCDDSSHLDEPDALSRSITFTNCSVLEEDSGNGWSDENKITATGTVSQQEDQDTDLYTNIFDSFSFMEIGASLSSNNDDPGIREVWEYGSSIDGSITTVNNATHFSTDQLRVNAVDNYTESENGNVLYESYFNGRYVIRNLAIDSEKSVFSYPNSHTGSGHIVRTVDNGALTLDFDIVTALTEAGWNYPCFTGGALEMTDSRSNTLHVLFDGTGITYTLNGVGETISCAEFAEELGIEYTPPA